MEAKGTVHSARVFVHSIWREAGGDLVRPVSCRSPGAAAGESRVTLASPKCEGGVTVNGRKVSEGTGFAVAGCWRALLIRGEESFTVKV